MTRPAAAVLGWLVGFVLAIAAVWALGLPPITAGLVSAVLTGAGVVAASEVTTRR